MDDPTLDAEMHANALRGLDRLQRVSRTATRIATAAIDAASGTGPLRWVDVACGSGRIATDVAAAARRGGRPVSLTAALDLSPRAAAAASSGRHRIGVVADARAMPLPDGWADVASSTLFLHHLEPADVAAVLREMTRVARVAIVDDLRRTRVGHVLAHLAGRLFSRSPVVHIDGPRSVEGAYSAEELREIARTAGLTVVRCERQWPQRMLLVLRRGGDVGGGSPS